MERPATLSGLADDLQATTVALTCGDRIGTGFFVGQDLVVTCAHVLGTGPPEGAVDGEWNGTALRFTPEPLTWRERDDLVVLRLADTGERLRHPWVCWSGEMAVGDVLGAFGHPLGPYRGGDSVRMVYDGVSFRTDGTELHRATQGRATHGFSGSPVINWRTGGVCGLLRRADNPAGGPPGVRIVPAATILKAYPDLIYTRLTRDLLERTWLQRLDDDMLRAGRWQYPGPRLRAYLEAVSDAAKDHPYAFARHGGPKLNTVYLRQQFRAETGSDERSAAVTVDEAMADEREGFVVSAIRAPASRACCGT